MFFLLLLVVTLSLLISFLCSLMEAALLSIPISQAQSMADRRVWGGRLILSFKENIGSPISSILILNTISHTVGATVSGALVDKIYGDKSLMWFSIVFTLLILYLSEIIPKQIGVVFYKRVLQWAAYPLLWLGRIFYPLILTTHWVSNSIKSVSREPSVSIHEILAMAKIGGKEGILDSLESKVIRNIILLDRKTVSQIFTPRNVVFTAPEHTQIKDIQDNIQEWHYARIPLCSTSNCDNLSGYVHQRDVSKYLLSGKLDLKLSDLKRPLKTIHESTPLDTIFVQMLQSREQICAVTDEQGSFVGIITLEDVIEEIVGEEIVDEYDPVADLRVNASRKNSENSN